MAVLSEQILCEIVEKSSFFGERLSSAFSPIDLNHQEFDTHYQARLVRWKTHSANNDETNFARRLTWSALDESMLRRGLAAVALINGHPLPAWVNTLRNVVDTFNTKQGDYADSYPYFYKEHVLPFERILLPFMETAKALLSASPAWIVYQQVIQPTAQAGLDRYLLVNLVNLFENILSTKFAQFEQDKTPAEKRSAFTRYMLREGLLDLLIDYPVAARFAAILIDSWIAFASEFTQQLIADWSRIRTTFGVKADNPDVIAIEAGLSDRHHCGKSVLIQRVNPRLCRGDTQSLTVAER